MKNKYFSLYGRRYYLKWEWLQSILFISIFLSCCGLSLWQLQRAEASQQQETSQQQAASNKKHNIELTGYWAGENFLLDNRTYKGKVGYYHLALFKPTGNIDFLVVNLGWLPAPILRSDIPSPQLPSGEQTITLANLPIIKPVVWSSDHWPSPNNQAWPKRIQSIDIERFELATQHSIETGYWQLISGKGKLIDIFQASPYLNKHKHLGYAMQWLLIAIAALMVGAFSSVRSEDHYEKT
jgi:cytochrome oxidase assembly protein ShyY1